MENPTNRSLAGTYVDAIMNCDNDRVFQICRQAANLNRREKFYFLLSVSAVLCSLVIHLDKSASDQIHAFLNDLLPKGELRP